MSPILAGILAFIDTNHNMELFGEATAVPLWKQQMWLNLFKDPKVTHMSYQDILSSKDGPELKELFIQMTGANGAPMSCQLPFSWLLKVHIDNLISQRKRAAGYYHHCVLNNHRCMGSPLTKPWYFCSSSI